MVGASHRFPRKKASFGQNDLSRTSLLIVFRLIELKGEYLEVEGRLSGLAVLTEDLGSLLQHPHGHSELKPISIQKSSSVVSDALS